MVLPVCGGSLPQGRPPSATFYMTSCALHIEIFRKAFGVAETSQLHGEVAVLSIRIASAVEDAPIGGSRSLAFEN